MKRADQVQEGDFLDFEGDSIVDPDGTGESFNPEPPATTHIFWAEFATVEAVERETPDCVVIYTDQGTYGFPPDHLLKTKGDEE